MKATVRNIISIVCGIAIAGCSAEHPDIDGGIIVIAASAGSISLAESRGANDIASNMPETIGVFAEIVGNDKRVFDNQCMYYKNGEAVKSTSIDISSWGDNLWPYSPTKSWMAGKDYIFYGYAPYDANNAELLQTSANINTFKFHNIPPLCATEYLVAKANQEVSSGVIPVFQFTHITSRLRFLFAIGEKYSQLRKIRITSIKISDSGSGTPYWECSIELAGANPEIKVERSKVTYVSDVDIELIPEGVMTDSDKPGLLLGSDYTTFSSAYNLLGQIANTTLKVTYDVYDTADQLLRKNQVAENVVDLSNWTFERGKCYDVRILVSPKYLYVLSDNDMPEVLMEPKETSESPSESSEPSTTS